MVGLYKLEGREVVQVDAYAWTEWVSKADRRVLVTENIPWQIRISTVFISFTFVKDGCKPVVFETRISAKDARWNALRARHTTWAAAVNYHADVMQLIAGKLEPRHHRFFDTVVANDDILVSIYRRKFRHSIRDCGRES